MYQRYLGWFDGNPANLHKHPPEAAGRRYIAAIGGAERLLAEAKTAFADDDYRWVAELVGHLVFAESSNIAARALQADAIGQMGYQAESGPWRDFCLTGAQELRNPRPPGGKPRRAAAGQLRTLPGDSLLDSLSVRLNGDKAGDIEIDITIFFSDTDERFSLRVENAVLHHRAGSGGPEVSLTHDLLVDLVQGVKTPDEAELQGSGAAELIMLLSMMDRFDLWFEISAP